MNEILILKLGASSDQPVQWAFIADSRLVLSDSAQSVAGLAAIADRAARAKLVIAVLRGEQVAMRALSAQPKSQAQLRAAAGFLLEDELAENLDQMHVTVSRHETGAGLAIAIKKPVIEDWLEALLEAGISPDFMSADFALLPMVEKRAVLAVSRKRIFGVIGLNGFALDRPIADELVPALLTEKNLTELVLYGALDVSHAIPAEVMIDQHDTLEDEKLFLELLKGLASAPNLLRGAYRKRRDWRATAGPWRRPAMLAAACLGALLVTDITASLRDIRLADQLSEETIALHQAAFPDAASADPRTHARQVLALSGGEASFLQLTNAVAQSVDSVNSVQIDRIRFNAERGEYAVNLRFSDIAEFEALKSVLEDRGVSAAETGGVRRTGGVYLGELRVSLS
ncbi:MAG: type II secretion system protein GspL [Pseudomonadota bacterium]